MAAVTKYHRQCVLDNKHVFASQFCKSNKRDVKIVSEIDMWAGLAPSEGCGGKPLRASLLASRGFLAIPGLPWLAAEPPPVSTRRAP